MNEERESKNKFPLSTTITNNITENCYKLSKQIFLVNNGVTGVRKKLSLAIVICDQRNSRNLKK